MASPVRSSCQTALHAVVPQIEAKKDAIPSCQPFMQDVEAAISKTLATSTTSLVPTPPAIGVEAYERLPTPLGVGAHVYAVATADLA